MAAFERRTAFRFNTPSSMMIVGPSGCGKTVFTTKLLLDHPDLFETPPKKIYYCYGSWQDGYKHMKQHGIQFHEGIPNSELLPVWFPKWGIVGLGRSDGRRRKRQTRLGSVHQTFPSSKRHGHLSVSRYVSTWEICQEHFQKRSLHRGFQEPLRSIRDA